MTGTVAQHLERIKIDGHFRHRTVGQYDATMAGAGLHADFAQADIVTHFG